MYLSKSIANGTKLLDAAIQIKVLLAALLDADKMVPLLDAALISASKVFFIPIIIVRNQIYAAIYVNKKIKVLDEVLQYWMQHKSLHPK